MAEKSFTHQKIERKWREYWKKKKIYEPDFRRARKPFYNLMMFPYPSAEGLHIGGVRTFTGVDIYGRFKRMQGFDVFEPIGLDGFGIHSENYALKVGKHPFRHAKDSEKNFYRQLGSIGNGFAWNERLETYDPDYYKWTQWIFIQLYEAGLAYRKKQPVNWCPSCKTVLADEQVISGKCERCSSEVVGKELEQWFFRITKYAERLLKNLGKIDWAEKVKIAQRNWIGKSEGALIKFRLQTTADGLQQKKKKAVDRSPLAVDRSPLAVDHIEIFTTRPDTLFGATYMVLAPEHSLIENLKLKIKNWPEVQRYIQKARMKTGLQRTDLAKDKTGVELKGVKAINPANREEIPIFVADYVLASYGTGAIMAVPAHDERDYDFAKQYKLPIIEVISPPKDASINGSRQDFYYEGEGILINSGKFNGMPSEKAKWEITKFVSGKKKIKYRLRDWLISRQRYWGPPIPMIYCKECASKNKGEQKEMPGWYAVRDMNLPVKLPFVKNFQPKGKGESPLASVKSFYEVKCPACGKKARRETDVSDTFLDSAWYYLRYPSVNVKSSSLEIRNSKLEIPWNREITRRWLPVDSYIGGAEHSVLHLLYARFINMAFYDLGLLDFEEPFAQFRAHGLITKDGAKMSKSKGNVVNPDEYLDKFGADAVRMYLAFLAPFGQDGDFRESGVFGIVRFLGRFYRFFEAGRFAAKDDKDLRTALHRTVKKVTEDIESLNYNTAISSLMVLLRQAEEKKDKLSRKQAEIFLKLMAPFAPYLAEELWQRLTRINADINADKCRLNISDNLRSNQRKSASSQRQSAFRSIHQELWPKYDSKLIKADNFELVIQVNGRVRDKVEAPAHISQKEAGEIAMSREKIKNWLKGRKVKKIIFVPKRLINIVI